MKNAFKKGLIYCDKFIIGLLLATVVIVPLFFDIRLYSVFDLSKVMALYLLTIAILVVWAIALVFKHGFEFSHTAIDIPILAYIFIFIISSVISINPIMSLFGTYKRFEGLTATLCYILIFCATVNFVTTRRRLYLLVFAIVAGAIISSIYGIAQHVGFDMFKWSSFEARRVFSTFGNPVFFSAYLVMTLPLAVVLFFSNSSQQKEISSLKNSYITWIFFVLSAIIYTTFWLTNTRACFVALLGGLFPLLIVISNKQTAERYKFAVLVISFVLIGIFFNVRHDTSVIKHFVSDVKPTDNHSDSSFNKKEIESVPISIKQQTHTRPWIANKVSFGSSTFSRIFQYLAATRIIKDYSVLGIGPDTIGIVYQKNLAKVFSLLEGDKAFPFPRQDRIHNDVLDITVTRGIFGLGTYVWLLIAFGVYVGRNYRRLSNQNKLLILGLSSGIVSYLIQNEFSFGNTPIVTLFWVMMGLCISIIKINETEGSLSTEESGPKIKECCEDRKLSGWEGRKAVSAQLPSFPPSRIPVFCKWIGCGIVLTALGFVSIFVVRFYRADAYFEYGRRILDYEKENLPAITEKGLFFMKHAIRLNPYETFYRDELCRTYIQNALKTKDEAWIQKAYVEANNSLKLIPHHYMGFFHLGMIQQFLAEHFNRDTADSAINYYKKAIDSDPFQAPFHSNLASLYINRGNLDQAIEELSQAYLIRPDEVNHADRLANAYLQKGDLDKALFFSRKTVELNPSESGYYNNLGAILSKKGMYEEAVNAFKKAIEINPKEPIYLDNLLKLYLSLEKYDELIPYYKKLIALDPSVADYHNNLGAIYKRKKQPKDAIESFQKAVTLKPDNPIYTHNLASGYVDLGKYAEAKDILQTFNKTYPNNNYINIHLLLADLYLRDTDWEKVISACEQAIKLDEKSIAAYKMLGMAYYNAHQYELAEKILNKTLTLDPNDQGAKDLLAKISNKVKKDL
ncbi:MAG TPA: tetratricopeptide repeat protein [Candidatus Wunengus sp. YC65]|uniref:tetratricopeptide repeat protein n=1 Tax=Candidatus Wunengus sp. YC65 TaxID=3367701 RepID=UPI00402568B1